MKGILIILIITLNVFSIYSQIQMPTCGKPWIRTYLDEEILGDCSDFESGDWVMIFQDEFDDDELNKDIWYTCLDNWNRGNYSEKSRLLLFG